MIKLMVIINNNSAFLLFVLIFCIFNNLYYSYLLREARLTDSPRGSPLSADTLSETAIADILRGCVQIMLQNAPLPDSISDSKTY